MHKQAKRPAWVEIDLQAAAFNIQNIKRKVGTDVKIMGIIKADGYGHGAIPMARLLLEKGISSFGVATLAEAIALRDAGITEEIVVLGLTPDLYVDTLIGYDLTPATCSFENAAAISVAALAAGKVVSGYVAVDSGMGRIGFLPDNPDSLTEIQKIATLEGFAIKGLFSHFATADAADKTFARHQHKVYGEFYDSLVALGIPIPERTLSNSAAVMELPEAHYDMVRPGIILYGCYPSGEVDRNQLALKPVMSVKANIIHLKKVGIGFSVGYGRKFIAERESLIGTLNLGYADGYPRPYSKEGKVIVGGVFAPIAGNICMDQCMIDVTDVADVKVGDEVILMGSDGVNTIMADDLAAATGTINYEIVCAFGQRLPKVYL